MKKFRIMEKVGEGCEEVVFKYPNFKTAEEGLAWICKVLDPEMTGRYTLEVPETPEKGS